MAEAEVFVYWQRQRLAEAEVEKPHSRSRLQFTGQCITNDSNS